MNIDVLCIPDCPHRTLAMERIREALTLANARAEIREVLVEDGATAARLAFPGSPTIRINGRDVQPVSFFKQDAGLQCRLYSGAEAGGAPSCESILRAIREALHEEGSMRERPKWAAPLAAIAAALGTLLCCLPLGFLGAIGAAGAGLFFSGFRIFFLILSPVFLALGFWQHYRAKSCNIRAHRISSALLWIATLAVLIIFLFPQWIASFFAGAAR